MTLEMIRCQDCVYLIEDEDGRWVCDDCDKEIHEIPLEDGCPVEQYNRRKYYGKNFCR